MALFTINRYGCESEEYNKEIHERKNLSNLQKKIKERLTRRNINSDDLIINKIDDESSKQKDINEQPNSTHSNVCIEQPLNEKSICETENASQFKILGTRQFEKKQKIKRFLPYWISHPSPISINLKKGSNNIEDIDYLLPFIKKSLVNEGICNLFPVQSQVIPWILKEHKKKDIFWPRDVCVSAPTGSGKTLTFVLPIVQLLSDRLKREIRALVVLPVKELAGQVAAVFKKYCIGTNLKVALIAGSATYTEEKDRLVKFTNAAGWVSEVDIVVCTAGRLVEHLRSTEGFTLRHLRFLVIDEADRIMQNIQNDWLYHLNRHVDFGKSMTSGRSLPIYCKTFETTVQPPQKLFFSATLSQDPEKLNEWGLFVPKLFSTISDLPAGENDVESIKMGKYVTPMELKEKYLTCDTEQKPAMLFFLLNDNHERTLCFTNSSLAAHRLSVLLKHMFDDNRRVAEISSALGKKARDIVLKKFQKGIIEVLVSTDALARGIDIAACDKIISYDPPKNIKTYIHRVGRTSRAGRQGIAITILKHDQLRTFKDMLRTASKSNVEEIVVRPEEAKRTQTIYECAISASRQQIAEENERRLRRLKASKRSGSAHRGVRRRKPKTNRRIDVVNLTQ